MKLRCLSLFAFAVLFLGLPAIASAEQKTVRVAAVLGLSGNASVHSDSIRKGVELAREELEQRGRKVEILWEDDQTDPKKTVSAIQSAVARGHSFFIGPTWSFQVSAARGVLEKASAVALVPAGSSDINGGKLPGVFNLSPPRSWQAKPISEWAKKLGLRQSCILTPNGDWGEIHRVAFKQGLIDAGSKVLYEDQYDYGADGTTLQSLILRLKQKRCDSLLLTGGPGDVANLIKGRNDVKLQIPVLATNDVRDALELKLLKDRDVEGGVFAVSLSSGAEFEKLYLKKYGVQPSLYADRGFDALMIYAEALEKTDGTAQAVRKYLEENLDYLGASGKIQFDAFGDVLSGEYQVLKLGEVR